MHSVVHILLGNNYICINLIEYNSLTSILDLYMDMVRPICTFYVQQTPFFSRMWSLMENVVTFGERNLKHCDIMQKKFVNTITH